MRKRHSSAELYTHKQTQFGREPRPQALYDAGHYFHGYLADIGRRWPHALSMYFNDAVYRTMPTPLSWLHKPQLGHTADVASH